MRSMPIGKRRKYMYQLLIPNFLQIFLALFTKKSRLDASCRVLGTAAVVSTEQQAHIIHQALLTQSRLIWSFAEKSCLDYPKSSRLSKNLHLFLSMKLCLPPPMNLCQPALATQMALQPSQSAPHLQKPRARKRS